MRRTQAVNRRSGYHLPDLIVAMVVGGVLLGLLLSATVAAQDNAKSRKCANNLKQLGLALKNCEALFGDLPPLIENRQVPPGGKNAQVTFFYHLLTYIEQDPLLAKTYPDAAATKVDLYNCPEDFNTAAPGNKFAYSNYVVNSAVIRGRVDPFANPPVAIKLTTNQAMEAASKTIVIGERLQVCGETLTQWAEPKNCAFTVAGVDPEKGTPNQPKPPGMKLHAGATAKSCEKDAALQSAHAGKVNVLRGDAGVSQFPEGFDPKSLNFYCLGQGRDMWQAADAKYTPFP